MWRSGDQIGPYTLINELGRGQFGTVWLSERRTTIATTLAALKIPLDDDVDLETIKQEASVWVRASGHPNVLSIIEANIYDGQGVIASEYAPDGSLESWLKQYGSKAPSVEVAVEITCGILAGLEHLHVRTIIHRDLKPANILFQGNTPRLTDFGLSRVLESMVQTSMAAGTPAFMAPEAFDGKRTEQTDVWSVGAIFYQLLTGYLPFPADSFTQLIRMIISRDPDPLPLSIPKSFQAVISRALFKDPLGRYKSAAEMRAAILTSHRGAEDQWRAEEVRRRREEESRRRKDQRRAEEEQRRREEETQAARKRRRNTLRIGVGLLCALVAVALIAVAAYHPSLTTTLTGPEAQPGQSPEEILALQYEYINAGDYEESYELFAEQGKQSVSPEQYRAFFEANTPYSLIDYSVSSVEEQDDEATVEAVLTVNTAAGEGSFPITQRFVWEEGGWRVVMRDEQIATFTET